MENLLTTATQALSECLHESTITNVDTTQIITDIYASPNVKAFAPKQQFHQLNNLCRVPMQKGMEYDAELVFLPHELRPLLEKKMSCEYGIASYDDLKEALTVLDEGMTALGREWDAIDIGWVKAGEGATVILVPKGTKLNRLFIANLKKMADKGKFNKYEKRCCAMYRHASWGKNERWESDDLMSYESNGRRWKVRYNSALPEGFKIEGCVYITAAYAQDQLGPNPDRPDGQWRIGDTGRWTLLTSKWMVKGHFMIWQMDVDATVWDTKTQIGLDEVFVGFMGPLHAGDLRLNIQPIVNFGLHQFAEKFAEVAMMSYMKDMQTEDGIFRQLSRLHAGIVNDPDCEGYTKVKNWRLLYAVCKGFEAKHEPFMLRDMYRPYRKSLLDIENGRVPVPAEYGIRAYYFVDPWCIGRDGRFYKERARLVGSCVYSPRLRNGEIVVMYRDPQTPNEWYRVMNVAPPSGLRLIDSNAMIVSPDIAMGFVDVQGGGDYDDCGNILRGEFVTYWDNRPQYAKAVTVEHHMSASSMIEDNPFAVAAGLTTPQWNKDALCKLIQAALDADAGIGMIVNFLLVKTAMAYYQQHNIMDLKAQYMMEEDEDLSIQLLLDIEWYETQFKAFDEIDIASDLEGAIDGIAMNGAKGGTDYNTVGKRIREFWETCRVVPAWALEGGFSGNGRVPKSCREKCPTVVMDPVSISLFKIKALRDKLDDYVNIIQWEGLKLPPMAIQTFPCSTELQDKWVKGELVRTGTVTRAVTAWYDDLNKIAKLDETKKYEDGYKPAWARHFAGLNRLGSKKYEFIAELERRTYKYVNTPKTYGAERGPKLAGRPKPVADGYLNNPKFFPVRVELRESQGLTRDLRFIALYAQNQNLWDEIVEITVKDGQVSFNGNLVGLDTVLVDGTYTMTYGYVRLN